jgi:hypothetical protein
MDNKNDKVYRNLITILKLFQSRPYHLAKYLMENEALTEDFLKKIKNSEQLNRINEGEEDNSIKALYFIDISHMKDFFDSLTDDKYVKFADNKRDLTTELNQKLDKYIEQERYEDAIRIRDYMTKNNIERKKDN